MGERVLHILFDGPDGPDGLATRMISEQRASGLAHEIKVIDMSADEIMADDLVDEIFLADKVFSWHS